VRTEIGPATVCTPVIDVKGGRPRLGLMRPAAEAVRPSAGGTLAAGAGWTAADDVALIHAFRAGDVAGFERVVRRHSHRLQVFCRHRLGPGAPAEDIVQEAFLRLLSAVDRVDERLGLTEAAAETLLVRARRRFRREFRRLVWPGTTAHDCACGDASLGHPIPAQRARAGQAAFPVRNLQITAAAPGVVSSPGGQRWPTPV
jgi:hypothetical protein